MEKYTEIKFDDRQIVAVVKEEDIPAIFCNIMEEDGGYFFDIDNILEFVYTIGKNGEGCLGYSGGKVYARTVNADKPSIKYDWSEYDCEEDFFEDNGAYSLFYEAYVWCY